MTAESTSPISTVKAETAPTHEDTRAPERYVTPRVDISEDQDGLHVTAELPGAAPDSIDVTVDSNVLTIKGRLNTDWKGEWVHQEWGGAQYFRQFTVGQRIDQGRINADFKDGVLKIGLPFAEETKPRQVSIQVA